MEVAMVLAVLRSTYGRMHRSWRICDYQDLQRAWSEMFIENETKITNRVYCVKCAGVYFSQLLFESNDGVWLPCVW